MKEALTRAYRERRKPTHKRYLKIYMHTHLPEHIVERDTYFLDVAPGKDPEIDQDTDVGGSGGVDIDIVIVTEIMQKHWKHWRATTRMTLLGRWATNLGNWFPTGGCSGMLQERQCVLGSDVSHGLAPD